jgi:hypothetical protein
MGTRATIGVLNDDNLVAEEDMYGDRYPQSSSGKRLNPLYVADI